MIDRINKAIDESGVSVAQVAEACHTSVQAIYKWRRGGVASVEPEHIFAVADLTKFSARWLTLGQGPERVPSPERMNALIDNYLAADDRGQKAVERAAEQESRYTLDHQRKRERSSN